MVNLLRDFWRRHRGVPESWLSPEAWDQVADEGLASGVIKIDGGPYPLVEYPDDDAFPPTDDAQSESP
jgi:hypothetical protein